MTDPQPRSGTVQQQPRRFLQRIDGRYIIPPDIEIERIVYEVRAPNDDGGTGWHYEYVCVCVVREVPS